MRRASTGWVRLAAGAAAALSLAGPAAAGPAVGQFELKTLDAEPGEVEFQSQNAYAFGNPRRKTLEEGDDLAADDNSLARQRNALELEFGITRTLKTRIGIEYEKERFEEPATLRDANGYEDLKLDEYAAEVIWVLVPRKGDGVGLGVVVEYEVAAEDTSEQTINAGPILEWAHGPWSATAIPMLVQHLGGERNAAGEEDEKIDFAYASQLKYRWSPHLDLALEAYGTVDRVGGRGGRSEANVLFGDFDQHRIGPVVYWNFTPAFAKAAAGDDEGGEDEEMVSLGIGTLFGLNDNTPATTLKLSMEVYF